jgi:hypothetical protein
MTGNTEVVIKVRVKVRHLSTVNLLSKQELIRRTVWFMTVQAVQDIIDSVGIRGFFISFITAGLRGCSSVDIAIGTPIDGLKSTSCAIDLILMAVNAKSYIVNGS